MRKIIAALNMTIDGFCDHTAGIPDEEIHQHYKDLLGQGDVILYGRTTYQLMEFWKSVLQNPSEQKSMNDFAAAIDRIPKIVFSRSIKNVDWESASIAKRDLKDEVIALKHSGNSGSKDIFVGSRSLIIQLLNIDLIDELQVCIHPVAAGKGLPLFKDLGDRIIFKLVNYKTNNGAIVLYYQPNNDPETEFSK